MCALQIYLFYNIIGAVLDSEKPVAATSPRHTDGSGASGLARHGQSAKAEKMWMRALAGYEKQNLAIYHERKECQKSEKMWKLVLAGFERVLVPGHPHISRVLLNLGECYKEAEIMLNRALSGYKEYEIGHEIE
ncbi:hypothetical protein V8E54_006946 [Elaphomyces granulatus]